MDEEADKMISQFISGCLNCGCLTFVVGCSATALVVSIIALLGGRVP